jgi:hypothetical protein
MAYHFWVLALAASSSRAFLAHSEGNKQTQRTLAYQSLAQRFFASSPCLLSFPKDQRSFSHSATAVARWHRRALFLSRKSHRAQRSYDYRSTDQHATSIRKHSTAYLNQLVCHLATFFFALCAERTEHTIKHKRLLIHNRVRNDLFCNWLRQCVDCIDHRLKRRTILHLRGVKEQRDRGSCICIVPPH